MNKKITLIGLGAMGAFLAPNLYKLYGDNFRVLADGKRGENLKNNGIVINGTKYHFTVIDSKDYTKADLIIIAVKNMQLSQAIKDIKNQVGENTIILSVLNGIDSEEVVAKEYGWEKVLYSYMKVSVMMKDSVASFQEGTGRITFGEASNKFKSKRVKELEYIFRDSAVPYYIPEDMILSMWKKFLNNIGENMVCAVLGLNYGQLTNSKYAREISILAMKEVIAIANYREILLTDKDISKEQDGLSKIKGSNKPSTLQDIEKQKQTEVEYFSGKIVKLGKEYNIATPVNLVLYNSIKSLEELYK